MKYSNMRGFDLYCPSETIKEVILFKLESGVDVNSKSSVRIWKEEQLLIAINILFLKTISPLIFAFAISLKKIDFLFNQNEYW